MNTAMWKWRAVSLGNWHERFGGGRLETQVKLCAGRLSYWIRPQIEHSSTRFDRALSSPKRLVRVAANSPATVDRSKGHVWVRFSSLSSFNGVVIDLPDTTGSPLTAPPLANHHFSSN